MKTLLPFLVAFTTFAQSPPAAPQNLRLVATELSATTIGLTTIAGANNPLGTPHQGWAAYWQVPDTTNIWVPEYTINGGATWTRCGNEWCDIGAGSGNWHYTETGTNWTYPGPIRMDEWIVRIRNLGPIRCPTCAYTMTIALSSGATRTIQMPPLPPSRPLPLGTEIIRQASLISSSPGLFLTPASVRDPDCDCHLFRVSFMAHTNHIYSFQRSRDLRNWELRPPEIDGEEGVMGFFDVFEGGAMYRVASREGVLP